MTTNSTKYFCKRGAVSARFILVDTSLRGEYYYDGQHGKYYFGARYFDPFFGMWMSPDPAGQFANPYTYGGDPINFVDPTGLFALDLGFASIGWDNKRGWNFSLSSAIMSYTWNQNGSKTYEASVGGSYQWWIVSLGAEMGYSYNTYSGHSLSTGGHVCVGVKKGEAGVCAGVEAGGSLYWDPYGNYLGATAYGGAFAQAQTSDNSSVAKLNGGYETGLMGMEGRGLYAGGNLTAGVSLYASWAENGGWNYGGGYRFEAWRYDSEREKLTLFGLLSLDQNLLAADVYDLNDETTANVGEIIEDSKVGEKSVVAHGTPDGKIRFEGGVYDAKSFYDNFLADVMDDNTKIINLYVCLGGYGGDASLAQELADYASQKRSRSIVVRAAVGYVKPIGFSFAGKELFTFNKDRLVGTTGKSGDIKVSNPQWKYFYGKIY